MNVKPKVLEKSKDNEDIIHKSEREIIKVKMIKAGKEEKIKSPIFCETTTFNIFRI